jgi:hypothetical protein
MVEIEEVNEQGTGTEDLPGKEEGGDGGWTATGASAAKKTGAWAARTAPRVGTSLLTFLEATARLLPAWFLAPIGVVFASYYLITGDTLIAFLIVMFSLGVTAYSLVSSRRSRGGKEYEDVRSRT